MDIITAIKTRRSVRKFKPDPVPMGLLKHVIEMSTWAPSATNRQGWRFIIIDDPKIKEKIVDQGGAIIIKDAPAVILVLYDSRTANPEYQDHIQSGAAATQNLLLAANNSGLGACWVCHLPPKKELRKIFKIPSELLPIACVLIGYGRKEAVEVPRKYPLDSLIGYNSLNFDVPPEKVNIPKLVFRRIITRFYYSLPAFLKKTAINRLVDKKFVKKFEN